MPNPWFRFKQFNVWQERSAFKVGTDGVLLGAWCTVEGAQTILDIGTGTGLIALMTAQRSEARITALEPDRESASEALQNIETSPWSNRIEVIENSLQLFSESCNEKFDLIVSNPPFFSDSLHNKDERLSSARHNLSLSINQLMYCSARVLSESGRISVILPYAEGNVLIAEAAEHNLFCNRMLKIKPLPGRPVKRILLEFSYSRSKPESGFLVIETGARHEYSHEYRELTREFYLHF